MGCDYRGHYSSKRTAETAAAVEFVTIFAEGSAIAYSAIPLLSSLKEPLNQAVRIGFADSIRVIWQVLIGVGTLGFVVSLGMKHMPLHTSLDRDWGLQDPIVDEESTVSYELHVTRPLKSV